MISARRSVFGLASLLALSLAWGYVEPRLSGPGRVVKTVEAAFVPDAAPAIQRANRRIRKPWVPRRIESFEGSVEVRRPNRIVAGHDGALFVLDGGDGVVKKVSPAGRVLTRFSDKRAARPTDFGLDSQGNLWLSDPNAYVVQFDSSGKAIAAWPPSIRVIRLVPLPGALFVMVTPLSERLFALRGVDGDLRREWGVFLREQRERSVLLVGHLAGAFDERLVFYVPQYGGCIVAYGADGEALYNVATIEAPPLPAMEVTAGGAVRLPRELPAAVRSIAVAGRTLYVIARLTPNWGPEKTIVDAYDVTTGAYRYSVQPPERLNAIAADGEGHMYSATDLTLAKWSGLP